MSAIKLMLDDTGNTTGTAKDFRRKKDDQGTIKVDHDPNSAPSTVTLTVQGRMGGEYNDTWFTEAIITETDLGTSIGIKTFAQRITIYPEMRVLTANNNDALNTQKVWIVE